MNIWVASKGTEDFKMKTLLSGSKAKGNIKFLCCKNKGKKKLGLIYSNDFSKFRMQPLRDPQRL